MTNTLAFQGLSPFNREVNILWKIFFFGIIEVNCLFRALYLKLCDYKTRDSNILKYIIFKNETNGLYISILNIFKF